MKISTKGRYALEIAADLAMHSDHEHRESLRNIARRRDLSEKYLERIVKMLCSAGIVSSARGVRGGYCLAKDARGDHSAGNTGGFRGGAGARAVPDRQG